MPNISVIDDIYKQQARGKSVLRIGTSASIPTTTAAGTTSGFFNLGFSGNAIGTTLPSTFGEFLIPAGISGDLVTLASLTSFSLSARSLAYLRIYKVGTVNLTATGNQFTHDTATFPLLRTEFGVANKAQALWPVIQLTTALTTTAAAFTFDYSDQDGNATTGTRTFIFPSATTTQSSAYFMPLEHGDWACRDISAVNVTTASATGAATIWLVEEIEPSLAPFATALSADYFFGFGLKIPNQQPAVATTGTVTTSNVLSLLGANGAGTANLIDLSVLS